MPSHEYGVSELGVATAVSSGREDAGDVAELVPRRLELGVACDPRSSRTGCGSCPPSGSRRCRPPWRWLVRSWHPWCPSVLLSSIGSLCVAVLTPRRALPASRKPSASQSRCRRPRRRSEALRVRRDPDRATFASVELMHVKCHPVRHLHVATAPTSTSAAYTAARGALMWREIRVAYICRTLARKGRHCSLRDIHRSGLIAAATCTGQKATAVRQVKLTTCPSAASSERSGLWCRSELRRSM